MVATIASSLSLLGGATLQAAGGSNLVRHGSPIQHSIPTVQAFPLRRTPVPGNISQQQQQKMWINCVGLNSGVASKGRHGKQSKQAVGANGAAVEKEKEVAILWFKHDLRVDDHPGVVVAVAEYKHVLPVFIFDPHVCAGQSSAWPREQEVYSCDYSVWQCDSEPICKCRFIVAGLPIQCNSGFSRRESLHFINNFPHGWKFT